MARTAAVSPVVKNVNDPLQFALRRNGLLTAMICIDARSSNGLFCA